MTRPMEFVAVMGADDAGRLEAGGGGPSELAFSRRGPLTAIFAPAPSVGGLRGLLGAAARGGATARKAAGAALVARQKLLEALMRGGAVLPAAPGARLAPGEARGALAASADALREALARLTGFAQHQVRISWDAPQALARFRDAPEIAAATTRAGDGRQAFARALAQGAAALRARLGAGFAADLAGVAEATAMLPPEDEADLLNLVALTDAPGLALLERRLEAIDAIWPEGLRIRLIGPSPAITFAAVAVERPDAADLDAAARSLGLAWPLEEPGRVSAAFRRAAAAAHPDAHPDTPPGAHSGAGEAVAQARAAAALLAAAGAARAARLAAGEAPEGPFLTLRSDAEGPAAPSRARAA
ncbi:GvpL/GvpF family gas vesicle protein [Rubrimonas cliftonensis]|uniref:Gas vesicle synthesis protein GvpL/GvpF n=1 Tax=Rubrimonas cliftonensis TaxID=89524 RepID=A0A1H4ALV3_9RHOB|nr:GvpL/GvpF family gas vesicle protein [Rubrimonas cliftonensis]SEA36946.1 Gas vesicle synthesis protein GvpL/GvpF [Rubrimonas cliftonensis]